MNDPITLRELTNPDSATRRLADAGLTITNAEPTYIRHKPAETTIVAYRFTVPGGSDTWGYAHWCADPRRADDIFAKATTLRLRPSAVGPGLTRLDPHTVLYGFPNDARLRKLRWYIDPRKVKRSLEAIAGPPGAISGRRTNVLVLRYKPERRVVARVDLATDIAGDRPLLLRYSTQRQAHRLARIAGHLRRHAVATPAPIAQLDNGRVGVDEFIDGRELRDIVRTNGVDGTDLADAMARFHTTRLPDPDERRIPTDDLDRVRRGLADLAAWKPALRGPAREVAEILTRTLPNTGPGNVLLHGDLHAKNILVSKNGLVAGETIVFVDLERVAMGPAAVDLGCFRAHAIALGIRQPGWSPTALDHAETMIERYRSIARPVAQSELDWHTAIGLVDQALLVTRHVEDRWPTTSAELLDAARRQLNPTSKPGGPLR